MDPRLARSTGVNAAVSDPPAPLLRTGAADWFEELYRESAGDVFSYVASLLRDRAAAEEVTAQAFERAFRRRRLYNARRGSPRAWLFVIARNAALDELRRRRRTVALADPVVPEPDASAGGDLDPERRAIVREAVAQLEPRDRELVLLRFIGQLSHRELARVLGLSESNAQTRLHRAMQRLREACDAD